VTSVAIDPVIGDGVAPRRANNATYEGRKLGLKL
jgi:hypothetical protein